MEFTLPLPDQLAKDGVLLRQWTNFSQRFHFHKNTSSSLDPLMRTSSMLLHASYQEINTVSEALKPLDIDLIKLSKILEAVEEVCLPRFILLFERFRYFTLEQESTESLNEFINILRKQVEICEFGKIKDSIMTTALVNGVIDENCRQSLQNSDGLCFDDAVSICGAGIGSNKSMLFGDDMVSTSQKGRKRTPRKVSQHGFENSMYMVPLYDSMSEDVAGDDHIIEAVMNVSKKKAAAKKKKKSSASNEAVVPFLCFMCDNEYAHRKSFRRHIASKHFDCKEYFCKHCRKTFNNRTECITHCKGHTSTPLTAAQSVKEPPNTEYLCWYCDEISPDLPDYKRHSETHTAVRVFSCELCQKKNHTIVRMFGHLKGHLNPRLKCEICANCFSKPELLEAHLKIHAAHPLHQCEVCSKSFVTADRLHGHMRSHSAEKKFTCELCGRSFSQKVSFDYHKRWHAGEKPYECDICGRRTRSFGDLRKHKRMHSDKRPYVCEVCGKSFRFISNLNRHRKGHSGKRSFICDVCGRSFIYGEGLRDHIKAGRCPGRRKEGETKVSRASRARAPHIFNPQQQMPMLPQMPPTSMDCNPINYATSHRVAEAVLNDFQQPPWQYMLRNNEQDAANNIVMVPPYH